MKKIFLRFITAFLALVSLAANAASELQNYVQQCQNELHFNATDVKPMNCNDGPQFAFGGPTPINDNLVYQKVNDNVDLVAACRWGDDANGTNNTKFASLELIIHNRQNGETCFFAAKDTGLGIPNTGDPDKPVTSAIVSPTNFSNARPNADDFWIPPSTVNTKTLLSDRMGSNGQMTTDPIRCVGCHSQGPYIASEDIAPYLAQYGLLNNRHDTYANMSSPAFHYHAVASSSGAPYNNLPVMAAFQSWDATIASNNNNSGCSASCHALASYSTIGNLFVASNTGTRLLPSISSDIAYLGTPLNNLMPPYADASNWRWINLDTPADGVDSENFVDAISASTTLVPTLLGNCAAPGNLEAHAVGVNVGYGFSTTEMAKLPDRLRTFNLKDGLVCMNSDQEGGRQCNNYMIRYLCKVTALPTWSNWYDTDSSTGDGDHEERSRDQNICGGATPLAIQAQVSVNGNPITIMGPNDRLARFSPYGLTCNNSDQSDGKCSNYVVRYSSCGAPPPLTVNRTLTNEDAIAGSKQLTAASGSLVKGQGHNNAWNTQQWAVESVSNTEYVRLRNTGTNVYLNVTSTAEQATVGTAAFSSTATGEMWTIEPVSNSADFRLKNLFSGRYLTMADPNLYPNSPDYLPIFSQGLNTGWNTQRWIIQ